MSTLVDWQWNFLPSVILIKILSYLPLSDRISACSTCKDWRSVLFYPSFWKKVELVFRSNDNHKFERSRFLASVTARNLRSCTLEFESVTCNCLIQADNVLIKLTRNPQVEELALIPSHCHTLPKWSHPYHSQFHDNNVNFVNNNNRYFSSNRKELSSSEWCSHCYQFSHRFLESAYECLQSVIVSTHGLKTLTLGCLQDITELADELLPLLGLYHKDTLSTLGLASVKCDPNSYALLHITPDHFACFSAIQVLTVDYDYVNDEFLKILTSPYSVPLRRLVFHVHGIDPSHRGTTEPVWHSFRNHNRQCCLVLNLIHSYEGVEQLNTGLLHPSMPLTTFRAFFCEWLNVPSLRLMSEWYSDTLEHIQLVDALDNRAWNILSQARDDEQAPPDPLVMMAWRCKKLHYLSLIGYSYSGTDLVAIARLRGSGLEHLVFPEACMEGEEPQEPLCQDDIQHYTQKVSAGLNRSWTPLSSSSLHPCLHTVGAPDTDEYVMPHILKDAQPFEVHY